MDAIDAFIDSQFWHRTKVILVMWGILGLFYLVTGKLTTKRQKQIAWIGVGLMVATVAFSMVFETLVPITRETSWAKAAPVGFGMLGMLTGVTVFCFGGWVFVRDTAAGMANASKRWLPIWAKGLLWLGGGATMLLLSIWLYRHGLTSN